MLRKTKRVAAIWMVMTLLLSLCPQLMFATAPSSSKAILSFSLEGTYGVIDESSHTINVTVPFRSAVTNMFEIFTVSEGAHIENHTSYSTRTNYSSSVTLKVVAEDNSEQLYKVNVIEGLSNLKSISSFSLSDPATTGFIDDEAYAVFLTVPRGTDVSSLKPSFATDGDVVKVGEDVQISGTSTQDFTHPVIYTVVALDGSTRDYLVTVNIQRVLSTDKEVTHFGLASLTSIGIIDETLHTISLTVPYGTNVSALVPTFITTGMRVEVFGQQQVSGEELHDFTSPVIYRVYDEANGHQDYSVTVTKAPQNASSSKEITAFRLDGVDGVIDEATHRISVELPNGSVRNPSTATFTTGDNSEVVRVGNEIQTSGQTMNDFTQPVIYTVFAENGLTQNYEVTVELSNQITSYNLSYPIQAAGVINEANRTITLDIPYGTNLSSTKADFLTTGDQVLINGVVQQSGVTENDLSLSPTVYAVDSESVSKPYQLILHVGLNPAKELTTFSVTNPQINGVVNASNHTVAMTVPYGTNVTALVPSFTFIGAKVKVDTLDQVSGVTEQNFTNPVTYSVYAEDATSLDYIVTVTIAAATATGNNGYVPSQPPIKEPTAAVFTPVVNIDKLEAFLNDKIQQAKTNPVHTEFSDVNKHWSQANIDLFVKLGVLSGYEDGTFKPDASITRAEFASIIAKVFTMDAAGTAGQLKDVTNHWASNAISALVSNGIIQGYEDGTFKPDRTISRAEIIAILGRIIDLKGIEKHEEASFKDINGSWNASEIQMAASIGLVEGRDANTFAPNAFSTRAEALTIILRALNMNPDLKSLLEQLQSSK
ncbi:hypothetical protein A8709_14755 [Paenibacillus pectinilyticus]|uniref:SLH domain-containing protein n=1 Tax=Paenibacillus pectinilyticus TaxID=512399 RepID=A0A1C1A459_9BACL|nr:S-layer homology domain-containing protein [Paenibacillus pectinilyticus]OCT15347.1 hypothetical protein A8709_14755 [Paenibacillus pectinilyticus]